MKKTAVDIIKPNRPTINLRDEHGNPVIWPKIAPQDIMADDESEKAPIGEQGIGSSVWSEIAPNIKVKYEVPSFDRSGGIGIMVSGKMPFTLGHYVQFGGMMESAGIGDIFTMNHELIASIRKFVYQEMPRVDEFSRDILDHIYSNINSNLGLNVPIKSIYEYLRNNYPKEFSKAAGGKNITSEQIVETVRKQKNFYLRAKTSSAKMKKTSFDYYDDDDSDTDATFSPKKGDNVSIKYKELESIDKKLSEKMKAFRAPKEMFVYVGPASSKPGWATITGRDSNQSQITEYVPTRVLKKFTPPKGIAEMQQALLDDENREKEPDSAKKQTPIESKFVNNHNLSAADIQELFNGDIFSKISQENFNKIISKSRNKKKIFDAYESYGETLSVKSREKFVNYKNEILGAPLNGQEFLIFLTTLEKMDYDAFEESIEKIKNKKPIFEFISKNENQLNEDLVSHYLQYKIEKSPLDLNEKDITRLLKQYDEKTILQKQPKLLPLIIEYKFLPKNQNIPLNDFEINWIINNHGETSIEGLLQKGGENKEKQFMRFYEKAADDNQLQSLPYDFKKYIIALRLQKNFDFSNIEKNDPAYKDVIANQPQQNVASRISNREIKISKREK